jgi:hypothetical protein
VFNVRGNWVNVLEEAWEAIGRDPPSVWIVKVRELPEEREQRKSIMLRVIRGESTRLHCFENTATAFLQPTFDDSD